MDQFTIFDLRRNAYGLVGEISLPSFSFSGSTATIVNRSVCSATSVCILILPLS